MCNYGHSNELSNFYASAMVYNNNAFAEPVVIFIHVCATLSVCEKSNGQEDSHGDTEKE